MKNACIFSSDENHDTETSFIALVLVVCGGSLSTASLRCLCTLLLTSTSG